jgi:hypothetical protein
MFGLESFVIFLLFPGCTLGKKIFVCLHVFRFFHLPFHFSLVDAFIYVFLACLLTAAQTESGIVVPGWFN